MVVVYISSLQEKCEIVVVEALESGKPVLISNKGNICRMIEANKYGFVDTETVAGTVSNFLWWLALSASDFAQMYSRARETFRLRFHIERAAMRLLVIVESALKAKHT